MPKCPRIHLEFPKKITGSLGWCSPVGVCLKIGHPWIYYWLIIIFLFKWPQLGNPHFQTLPNLISSWYPDHTHPFLTSLRAIIGEFIPNPYHRTLVIYSPSPAIYPYLGVQFQFYKPRIIGVHRNVWRVSPWLHPFEIWAAPAGMVKLINIHYDISMKPPFFMAKPTFSHDILMISSLFPTFGEFIQQQVTISRPLLGED